MSTPNPAIAYLAGGKIHVLTADGKVRSFASQFGEDIQNRALQIEQRHNWKTQGRGAAFMSGGVSLATASAAHVSVAISSICRARDGLLYALDTPEITGVFALDTDEGGEQRLFHSNEMRVDHLAPRPGSTDVACSVRKENGAVHLALLDTDRGGLQEITEGDSVDEAPAWQRGGGQRLVYQSAGIARDPSGYVASFSPSTIELLDFPSGQIETLAEAPAFDFLVPRMTGDDTLYYIRRPHKKSRTSPFEMIKGILLFPFHFFMALFHIVDNINRSFGKKPLIKAGGAEPTPADDQVSFLGQVVDLRERVKGRRRNVEKDPEAALVPDDWQLVRQSTDGTTEVLGKGVVSFDLVEGGGLVYSNGNVVFHLDAHGERRRLGKGSRIQQVVVLGG